MHSPVLLLFFHLCFGLTWKKLSKNFPTKTLFAFLASFPHTDAVHCTTVYRQLCYLWFSSPIGPHLEPHLRILETQAWAQHTVSQIWGFEESKWKCLCWRISFPHPTQTELSHPFSYAHLITHQSHSSSVSLWPQYNCIVFLFAGPWMHNQKNSSFLRQDTDRVWCEQPGQSSQLQKHEEESFRQFGTHNGKEEWPRLRPNWRTQFHPERGGGWLEKPHDSRDGITFWCMDRGKYQVHWTQFWLIYYSAMNKTYWNNDCALIMKTVYPQTHQIFQAATKLIQLLFLKNVLILKTLS